MVRYLIEKWNIPLSHFATNLYSRYFEDDVADVIENAVDNNSATTFSLKHSTQRNFTNGEVLFESKIIGSVLNPFSWTNGTRGISQGDNILLLRTGYDDSRLSLKAEVKVQLLRQADVLAGNETWFTLTNIAANNLNEAKSLQFYLLDTSNDFIGYRLVANGTGGDNWGLEIDDFIPSLTRVTANSPRVLAFASSLFWDTIYNTNTLLFSNGFTNTLLFDQEVYGLQASDFEVSNGIIHSFSQNNPTNYTVVVKPFSFDSNSVQQHQFLYVTLPEAAVSNTQGDVNSENINRFSFYLLNPLYRYSSGRKRKPAFADLDKDGDLDMISGEGNGGFIFYSNKGNGTYTEYSQTHANNPFRAFNVGLDSAPSFVDLDGDGDIDVISGAFDGKFYFYSNEGNGTYTEYDENHTNNPFAGFDVEQSSTPCFVDIDGDGDTDMVSGEFHGEFTFYSNKGNGTYTEYDENHTNNPFKGFDVGSLSAPAFNDLDGDGDLDMISGEGTYGDIWFYSNQGGGTYTEYRHIHTNNPFREFNIGIKSGPTFVDIDGDGDLDLIVGIDFGRFIYLMRAGEFFIQAR